MAKHYCDGRPEKPSGDLGPFTSGATDMTNIKGKTEFPGDAGPNAAIATWGGSTGRAKKNSSIEAHGNVSLPK